MKDLKLFFEWIMAEKKTMAATGAGLLVGALCGVMAFYQGWLG